MSCDSLSLPASPVLGAIPAPTRADPDNYVERLKSSTFCVRNLFWMNHSSPEVAVNIADGLLLTGSKGLEKNIHLENGKHSAHEIFKGRDFKIYQSGAHFLKPIKLSLQSLKEDEDFIMVYYRQTSQSLIQAIYDSSIKVKVVENEDGEQQSNVSPSSSAVEGAPIISATTGKVFAIASASPEGGNIEYIRISTIFDELKAAAQAGPNDLGGKRAIVAGKIIQRIQAFNNLELEEVKVPEI